MMPTSANTGNSNTSKGAEIFNHLSAFNPMKTAMPSATNICVPILAYRRRSLLLLLLDRCLDSITVCAHLHDVLFPVVHLSHVALTIEYRGWLYLQFARMYVAIHHAIPSQLQQIFCFDVPGDLTNDVGLVAGNVAFYIPASANYNLSRTVNIANNSSINSEIAVTANVSFHCGARTDQGSAVGPIGFFITHDSRFVVKHRYLLKIFL